MNERIVQSLQPFKWNAASQQTVKIDTVLTARAMMFHQVIQRLSGVLTYLSAHLNSVHLAYTFSTSMLSSLLLCFINSASRSLRALTSQIMVITFLQLNLACFSFFSRVKRWVSISSISQTEQQYLSNPIYGFSFFFFFFLQHLEAVAPKFGLSSSSLSIYIIASAPQILIYSASLTFSQRMLLSSTMPVLTFLIDLLLTSRFEKFPIFYCISSSFFQYFSYSIYLAIFS